MGIPFDVTKPIILAVSGGQDAKGDVVTPDKMPGTFVWETDDPQLMESPSPDGLPYKAQYSYTPSTPPQPLGSYAGKVTYTNPDGTQAVGLFALDGIPGDIITITVGIAPVPPSAKNFRPQYGK